MKQYLHGDGTITANQYFFIQGNMGITVAYAIENNVVLFAYVNPYSAIVYQTKEMSDLLANASWGSKEPAAVFAQKTHDNRALHLEQIQNADTFDEFILTLKLMEIR